MENLVLTGEGCPSITAKLFGKEIPSPLIVGSGTLIEKFSEINPFLEAGAGAVVPRSTRKILQRETHPVPHLHQYGSKKYPVMLNAEWTGADIEYWKPYLSSMPQGGRTIMSISGRDIKGCVSVCKELDAFDGWLYFEINISCAHSNNVHGMITRNEEHVKEIVSSLKDSGIKTPIVIKLGYSDNILYLAHLAKEAGVDGIVAINTYGPVFDFNIDKQGQPKPLLGIESGKGGLSGSPLFHIALTTIAEMKRQVDIPIIGCGGATSAESIIKMLMAGAEAVQVYTAAHVRGIHAPSYFLETNRALLDFMKMNHIQNIPDIIGRALYILEQKTNLEVKVPVVEEDICIGCDLCIPICLPQAITIKETQNINKQNHIVKIDEKKCIGCGHCVPVCPVTPKALLMPQS